MNENSGIEDYSKTFPMGKKVMDVWRRFLEQLAANPDCWTDVMNNAKEQQSKILSQVQSGDAPPPPPKGDRRFTNAQWQENPFFSCLMQNYLMSGETLLKVIDKVDMSDKDKQLLRFVARQYVDAIAPSNFPMMNPDVMEESMKSGGKNFFDGMKNFTDDVQQGAISNTDKNAFTIGKNIACAAGSVIYQNHIMQIIEYAPQSKQVHARPLLIVPPCINKYYILDLQEKNSLINTIIAGGYRVFLVSWVNADTRHQHLTWDDYLRDGVMNAMEIAQTVSRQAKINVLGYCIGGTLLASALAVLANDKQSPAQSLTLLTAMLDFSDSGEIGLFVDEEYVAQQEEKYAAGGVMDGADLANGFAALRPNDLIWPYFINNYYRGRKPQAFDLLYWNADSTNLPGPLFAEYLRATYLENKIARKQAVFCGEKIDLKSLKMPAYAIACEKDHIVPWTAAYASARLLGAKNITFTLAASGHVAGVVNPPSVQKGWHQTAPLATTANAWIKKAPKQSGSWWQHWLTWLAGHSGSKTPAPQKLGTARYAPIEAAPGSYVRAEKFNPKVNSDRKEIL